MTPFFPIIVKSKDDMMIYVFLTEDRLRKTYWDFYIQDGYRSDIFIDSKGSIFKVKNTEFVKYGKFGGYNFLGKRPFSKGSRIIWIDFEYESKVEYISLNELKNNLKHMVSQKQDFWEESFGDIHNLYKLINETKTYNELFLLFY